MAEIIEAHGSRSGSGAGTPSSTQELRYQVLGTRNEIDVVSLIAGELPGVFNGHVLQGYSYDEDDETPGQWDVLATYVLPEKAPPREGTTKLHFDTTGGTTHISHGLGQTVYNANGRVRPVFNGAINVTKQGVEGLDIPSPKISFGLTMRLAAGLITPERIKFWARSAGKTNSDVVLGFEPGELLFYGVTGEIVLDNPQPVDVSFQVAASENVQNVVQGQIQYSKKGWQYIWFWTEEVEDAAAGQLVTEPICAVVDTVFGEIAFADLWS